MACFRGPKRKIGNAKILMGKADEEEKVKDLSLLMIASSAHRT